MADDEQETKPRKGKAKLAEPADQIMTEGGPVALADVEPGMTIVGDEPSAVVEPGPGELEAAVAGYGQALDRQHSGYDLSEEAHLSAIEQAEEAATNWEVHCASLVWDTRDFLLEQIKRRPKPWSGCSPTEQRDIAAACEHAARELVRKAAEALASGGQPSARVLLGQITLGDDIKISGKVKMIGDESVDEVVLFLHRAHGQHVMLTLASKDAHQEGQRAAPGVPVEEPELEFEAGADEIPGDDSDLRDAGGPKPGPHEDIETKDPQAQLATGDLIRLEDEEMPIRVRVNLKTEMIEGQLPTSGEWDIDVRNATPEEMAAERERTADFEPA